MAVAPSDVARLFEPIEDAFKSEAMLERPSATVPCLEALLLEPNAVEPEPVAWLFAPSAVE